MNDEYERLTNDARYLLLRLSTEYLNRINDGTIKRLAVQMGNAKTVHDTLMPEWRQEDVEFTMAELRDADFMGLSPGDDSYYRSWITTSAIAWREQKFGNDVKKIIDAVSGIKKLIPFF